MAPVPNERLFDSIVIGGGSAGYAAARSLAAGGHRTAIVDGAPELGGLCILRGCMPTKALLYATEIGHLARQAGTWGVRVPEVRYDLEAVRARKEVMIADFAEYRRGHLTSGRFELFRSTARFLDPHTVVLADGVRLRGDHFVIATGSRVAPPPFPVDAGTRFLTSDEALELKSLPQSLIVLGGGAVACEFSQFYARLGVRVVQVQRSSTILSDFDPDVAGVVETVFRREGIELRTGTSLTRAGGPPGARFVDFHQDGEARRVEAEEVLLALGRSANTAGLNLAAAGVACEGDRVVANRRQQTSAGHIFAAGDCTGPHEIVHLAIQQGEVAAHNILSPDRPREMDYRLLLQVVFTDPQVAIVGLTEREAGRRNLACRAASHSFGDHGKSLIMEARDGLVKLLADPDSGEILGGACVGPLGGELIHEIAVAMARRMTAGELAAVPHYHPTLAEIWTYPAEALSVPEE